MEFLGVILENGTVQMDPAKLKGIADQIGHNLNALLMFAPS